MNPSPAEVEPLALAKDAPSPSNTESEVWTNIEVELLHMCQECFGRNACQIAKLLPNRTCHEVHTKLALDSSNWPQDNPDNEPPITGKVKGRKQKKSLKVNFGDQFP